MGKDKHLGLAPAVAMQSVTEIMKMREQRKAAQAARPSRWTEGQKKIINTTMLALGGLGLALGVVFAASKLIGKVQENNALKNADDLNRPEGIANGLKQAMKGMGTDEEKIWKLITQVPHKEFWAKVKKEFTRLTGDTLIEALESDLDQNEFDRAIAMIQTLPIDKNDAEARRLGIVDRTTYGGWADRLDLAFEGFYTWEWPFYHEVDIEAVYQVLSEIPKAQNLMELDRVFKARFHEGLMTRMKSNLTDDQWSALVTKIKDKFNGKS